MRNLIDRIEQLWCETMHTATMWPIHGSYRCGTCLREYPVAFEAAQESHSTVCALPFPGALAAGETTACSRARLGSAA